MGVPSLSIDYFELKNPDKGLSKAKKNWKNEKFQIFVFSLKFDEFRTKNDYFQTRVG